MKVKEDWAGSYSLTSGLKCAIYLQLLLTENTQDKLKWFKVIQISNQSITENEFKKFTEFRDFYKVGYVNMEQIETKASDIFKARNYVYRKGEIEKIANKKFDRALVDGTLHKYPNVPHWKLTKEDEVAKLQSLLVNRGDLPLERQMELNMAQMKIEQL